MHTLTIGRTETGKTRLQKAIAGRLYRAGLPVLVCDPLAAAGPAGSGWAAHRVFHHLGELVIVAKRIQSAHIFVDEAGQSVDAHDTAHQWLATTGRHRGHSVHFIGQRHTQLPPNIRDQCSRLYCFRVGADDARQLANTWAADELRGAPELGPGEFFIVSGTTCTRFFIDFRTGKTIQKSQ
jgi:hypothetical protein